jgi:translation initiation factor 2 subunit 3
LGYADCDILKCPKCPEPECWTIHDVCENCGEDAEIVRRISFVDAPGHEILMQVMLSGAALMDGVMLIIAANNTVPQPQTREHLAALTALGIDKIVVVQNKVDLVTTEQAQKNYKEIRQFLKGTIAEGAPVVPMSAMHGANTDILLSALQHFIPTPERDEEAALQMMAARSFDINRPGTHASKLRGGVLGGSLTQGIMKIGDKISIVPGLKRRVSGQMTYIPVHTEIRSIQQGNMGEVKEAKPGGLLAIQTSLDPSMARSDNLAGNIVSAIGSEPPVVTALELEVNLFDEVVGSETQEEVRPISPDENILLTVGTATTVGKVRTIAKKGRVIFDVKPAIAMNPKSKIALSRQYMKRYRLIGYGEVHDYEEIDLDFND